MRGCAGALVIAYSEGELPMKWWQEVTRDTAFGLVISGIIAANLRGEVHPHLDLMPMSPGPMMLTPGAVNMTLGTAAMFALSRYQLERLDR